MDIDSKELKKRRIAFKKKYKRKNNPYAKALREHTPKRIEGEGYKRRWNLEDEETE